MEVAALDARRWQRWSGAGDRWRRWKAKVLEMTAEMVAGSMAAVMDEAAAMEDR